MRLGDNHLLAPTHAWEFGPVDPPDDGRLHTCPCGLEYATGAFAVVHNFEPCRAYLEGESNG